MIMKKKLSLILLVCFFLLSGLESRAQYLDPRIGIYFSNPLSLLSKAGIKAEYRLNLDNAILGSYTQYWGYFPGYQASFEYRRYFADRKRNGENFIYTKAGGGFADYKTDNPYHDLTVVGDGRTIDFAPGNYLFGEAGIGRHFNFGAFFMEINGGLRYTQVTNPPVVYNEHLFYTLGPGSIVDVNFHFGFQFR